MCVFPLCEGQWGWPTVSIAAVLGIFAGSIGGMMESVGDYSACAELTRSTPIPSHAVNRGRCTCMHGHTHARTVTQIKTCTHAYSIHI